MQHIEHRLHKSKTGQLDCLLDTEKIYNRLRKKSAPSIPQHATSVI